MVNLKDRDWHSVLEAIKRKQCILITGPDIVGDVNGLGAGSVASQLAKKLAHPLSPEFQNYQGDLSHVAQLRYEKDGHRSNLEFEVKEFFAPLEGHTSTFYRDLSALPFTLCLTTTPDYFLAQAFQDEGKKPIQEFYHFRSHRQPDLSDTTPLNPIVYGLYGDLQALDSLVLTETDLLEFLVNIVRNAPSLPPYIAGQLADKQMSFLFLGFGFQAWYARVLLHVLQICGHRIQSLAIEAQSFFTHPDKAQMALFFEKEHKIEFRQHSWKEFAAELRQRYEKHVPTRMLSEPTDNGPIVFLCHDSRDWDQVARLEQVLNDQGIGTWRDRQNLRGGDKWDRIIQRVIDKQVDYVLVLQTPNMLQRAECYLHKEIHQALERQKRFDEGERFLVPALLQACQGLSRLNDLHSIDLTTQEGITKLIKDILADWPRRQKREKDRTSHE